LIICHFIRFIVLFLFSLPFSSDYILLYGISSNLLLSFTLAICELDGIRWVYKVKGRPWSGKEFISFPVDLSGFLPKLKNTLRRTRTLMRKKKVFLGWLFGWFAWCDFNQCRVNFQRSRIQIFMFIKKENLFDNWKYI